MRKLGLLLVLVGVGVCGCASNNSKSLGDEFVGLPYAQSPLGEGRLPDDDPTIRFDAFDCTTIRYLPVQKPYLSQTPDKLLSKQDVGQEH